LAFENLSFLDYSINVVLGEVGAGYVFDGHLVA
jgi:hypothetical protein